MAENPSQEKGDAGWVTIDTPFDAAGLGEFLEDIERLYRINSMLEFADWRQTGERQYFMSIRNLSSGMLLETHLDMESSADSVTLSYSDGLKTSTTFRVEAAPDGLAKLVVTDDYSGTSIEEREKRVNEVDNSLVQWGGDLHKYMRLWKRWSWVPGWKFYMRRMWQPMKPLARRIAFILIVVTMAEFIFFLFVFGIFWLELDKYIG
jgi:hypothetical protein